MGRDANINILSGKPLNKIHNEQMKNAINLLISTLDKKQNTKIVAYYFRYKSDRKGIMRWGSRETDWTVTVETKEATDTKYYTLNSSYPTTINQQGSGFPLIFNDPI